jgi:hypothetical protein
MFLKMSDILDVRLGTKLTIYKFEEIPDCVEKLKSKLSIDGDYKHYNHSNKSIEKNITQETKELIYELYKEDFENFNYDIDNIEEPTTSRSSLNDSSKNNPNMKKSIRQRSGTQPVVNNNTTNENSKIRSNCTIWQCCRVSRASKLRFLRSNQSSNN